MFFSKPFLFSSSLLLLLNMALCGLAWYFWPPNEALNPVMLGAGHSVDLLCLNVYKETLFVNRSPQLGFMHLQDTWVKSLFDLYLKQNQWPALCTHLFNRILNTKRKKSEMLQKHQGLLIKNKKEYRGQKHLMHYLYCVIKYSITSSTVFLNLLQFEMEICCFQFFMCIKIKRQN